jgi:hypothetical protein
MKTPIRVSDIAEKYIWLKDDKKLAVTNLIESDAYVSICCHDKKGKDISLDWKGDPAMSLHLIMGAILTGGKEFGRLWLNELQSKLSRTM